MATRKHPPYGDKRDYPKIDLFYGGRYVATTTWARTVAEAKRKYLDAHPRAEAQKVEAHRQ